MSSRTSFIQTGFLLFLAIALLLSACQQIILPANTPENISTSPSAPDPSATITPSITEPVLTSTDTLPYKAETATPTATLAPGTAIYEISTAESNTPSEILYQTDEWVEEGDNRSRVLRSLTVPDCRFLYLVGREANYLEGPFSLQAGENAYEYLIERFPKEGDQDPSSVHYYFHHFPKLPEFPEKIWSFEMVSSPESEAGCFEAVQPLLQAMTVSKPSNLKQDELEIFFEDQRIAAFCTAQVEGQLAKTWIDHGQMLFTTVAEPGKLMKITNANTVPQLLVESKFPNGSIQEVFGYGTILYLDVDTESQEWALRAYTQSRTHYVIMDSGNIGVLPEMLDFYLESNVVYIAWSISSPDEKTYRIIVQKVDLSSLELETVLEIPASENYLSDFAVSNGLLVIEQRKRNSHPIDWTEEPILTFDLNNHQFLTEPQANGAIFGFSYPKLIYRTTYEMYDTELHIYNFETKEEISSIFGIYPPSKLSFDGHYFSWLENDCSGCSNRYIRLWDTEENVSRWIWTMGYDSILNVKPSFYHLYFVISLDFRGENPSNHLCQIPLTAVKELNGPMQTYAEPIPSETLEEGFTLQKFAMTGYLRPDLRVLRPTLNDSAIFIEDPSPEFGEFQTLTTETITSDTTEKLKVDDLELIYSRFEEESTASVYKDNELAFEFPVNRRSDFIFALFEHEDDIYVEMMRITLGADSWIPRGIIYRNGITLAEEYGYDETFKPAIFQEKLFFFFFQDGKLGFRWGDHEQILPYTDISRYICCMAGLSLNPTVYDNAITFYAEKNGHWYYVILSRFGED